MKWLKALLVIVILLAIAAYGLRTYLVSRLDSKLSPTQKAVLQEMRTQIVSLDQEALRPKPFEPATIEAARKVLAEWDAAKEPALELLSKFRDYENPKLPEKSPAELKQILDEASRFDPLTAAYTQLVGMPDFEPEVFAVASEDLKSAPTGTPVPNFLTIQSCAKLLMLKSLAAADEGRCQEAMVLAETIARGAFTPKYAMLITQLIGVAEFNIAARTWYNAIQKCDDPAILKSALENQNQMLSKATFITTEVPVVVLDSVGSIRAAGRAGIEINSSPMTGEQLRGEQFRVEAEYLEKIVLPNVENPETAERLRKQVRGYRGMAALSGASPRGWTGLGGWFARPIVGPALQAIAVPNLQEAATRSNASRTLFDLLRIATAAKLHRLETGKDATTLDDLVPKYLPQVPVDLFAPGREPCSILPQPYSVGPDGTDQKAMIPYDPTNGTISPGDIILRPAGQR